MKEEKEVSAQKMNITAGILMGETVKTTLGPKGMDKMLINPNGEIIITNDGVTILREMNVNHPAAKMMIEVSKTQEAEAGDGTTTAVVLAGEFLKQSLNLIEQGIHPIIISQVYHKAQIKCLELLEEKAMSIDLNNDEVLKNVIRTALTGKSAETNIDKITDLVFETVKKTSKESINYQNIKIEKRTGGGVNDSSIINGLLLNNTRTLDTMKDLIINPKILLLTQELKIKETDNEAQIRINTPEQLQAFLDQEEAYLKKLLKNIKDTGADLIICQKGIDENLNQLLNNEGITVIKRVKPEDVIKLSKTTGAKIIHDVRNAKPESVGVAGKYELIRIGNDYMTSISECPNTEAITILLRGGTEHVIDEIERAIVDSLGDLNNVLKTGKVVKGGGTMENILYNELMNFSKNFKGKEMIIMQAYAKALLVIPKTLSDNAGLDTLTLITELNKNPGLGINVINGELMDMVEVLEPLKTKTQAITGATEAANMILRIDDNIAMNGGETDDNNK